MYHLIACLISLLVIASTLCEAAMLQIINGNANPATLITQGNAFNERKWFQNRLDYHQSVAIGLSGIAFKGSDFAVKLDITSFDRSFVDVRISTKSPAQIESASYSVIASASGRKRLAN